MKHALALLAAAMPVALPAKEAPPPVLQAIGPWRVHGEQNLCLLSRKFGAGAQEVTIGFQPVFDPQWMEMLVISQDTSAKQFIGEGKVGLAPAGPTEKARYFSLAAATKGMRYTRITIPTTVFTSFQSSTEMTIDAKPVSVTIKVPMSDKGVATLRLCEQELLKSWGVDPATMAPDRAAAAVKPWLAFSAAQYPLEAFDKGWVGRVVAVVQVDAKGTPSACRVVVGVAAPLNEATCTGAMKRVTYTPGKDAAGNPTAAAAVLSVYWQIDR